MSALPPKADIGTQRRDVRYVPEADILHCGKERRYSITSSARAIKDFDTSSPSAFAVVTLISRSNFVGCSTGKSLGFAPRRILSTNSAARLKRSGKFGPYDIRPPAVTNARKPATVGKCALRANVFILTLLKLKSGSD